MPETFAQYLEKWLKQSTAQGLNNPLVKMPIKRFRQLAQTEFNSIANGGAFIIGTMSDPIARNLYKNFQTRIRERGEHSAFICSGSVRMTIAGAVGQQAREALFPICLKRATLQVRGNYIKVAVSDEAAWEFNPVLKAHLRELAIKARTEIPDPEQDINWLKSQLGNRTAITVSSDKYVGLFSSQQMVVQERLAEPPLRRALARNAVVQAKISGSKVGAVDSGEITDDGLEELGLVLPCDDSQLRVVQLSHAGYCLQVEGPPGTGKSQTIANIISNALYHGRTALLVCDKKAAIVQVEERLSNAGLRPALLNLHDEDLDKREFLKQAAETFTARANPPPYPRDQLRETRKTLNERVRFGCACVHPAVQITKREALAGMIRLRKELRNVPNVPIANWRSLSRERLSTLTGSIAEWPGLAAVLNDQANIWNRVRPETFDDNPNAVNELQATIQNVLAELESLREVREWAASLGIESPLESDSCVSSVIELVQAVRDRPKCHPKIVGNPALTVAELDRLHSEWDKRNRLVAARHPVALDEIYLAAAEAEAQELLRAEHAESWQDLSEREAYHIRCRTEIGEAQNQYLRFCDQIGLVYSPLLKVRRAQLQAILGLRSFGDVIPREWWTASTNPVLQVEGWIAKLRACANHVQTAPVKINYVALEQIAHTHWKHVEAMAEHGFNMVSYCLNFVDDRKCKFALRQACPGIPTRGFNQWREVTLHAVTARINAQSLRSAADVHSVLKQLTENYLSVAHEGSDGARAFVEHEDVQKLKKAADLVERWRRRNDLFQVENVHWQTFWESPNPNLLAQVEALLSKLDALVLPDAGQDDLEEAFAFHEEARKRIARFCRAYEKRDGDRTQRVMAACAAQEEYARCKTQLASLAKYLDLQEQEGANPDWNWLRDALAWRDQFEKLCGHQKLDVDSILWQKVYDRLKQHQDVMNKAYNQLESFFDAAFRSLDQYAALRSTLDQIQAELPRHPLWLEKNRWNKKIRAYPELDALWKKVLEGEVSADLAGRLFCFNLLRLCSPIPNPSGPQLKQTLATFVNQDEKLAEWTLEDCKAKLRQLQEKAGGDDNAQEAGELRRLATLQRVRGTVREILNAHIGYLLEAKACWMMSPTSLANLIASDVFDEYGIPFDLVIFDEASQIRVLDGLLSMAFGKQVIIVGDKNQLPPTDFFASFANPEAEVTADSQDFGISESLLDEFAGVFDEGKTHVMLMSHYRSETPDLIRFSNDKFYNSKLEMYPPAHVSGIGRQLHYVANGVYGSPTRHSNDIEADEVVKLIEAHVRECPDKSLGIVTMNIPQMELIDEKLQFAESEAVRAFCADESKFFLRNLETVQGDEMDRIILSLTYGKNAAGQFNASFLGPLTKSGGERRLNVAITRSRSGMIIVSSLKAADLEANGAQSSGFKCLKELLTDLENMEQARNYGICSRRFERRQDGVSNVVFCDSPFEEEVVEFLENQGYEIECQYGSGRFRLDIVVKERGKNLLAIECDGLAYHSSLVARTRDRARQRILEERGWRIHRVWSTNWWSFERQEKEAIIDAINSAREVANRQRR